MFHEANRAAEGLTSKVIDRGLPIIEMRIGNTLQELIDQILNNSDFLTNRRGTYLFMVSDDDDFLAQVERDECHNVALTGFVDDDNIESRFTGIKIFDDAGERHNPNGHRPAAIRHLLCGLG